MQISPIETRCNPLVCFLPAPILGQPSPGTIAGDLNMLSPDVLQPQMGSFPGELQPEPQMGGFLNALAANYAPPQAQVMALMQGLLALCQLLAGWQGFAGGATPSGLIPWPGGTGNAGTGGAGMVAWPGGTANGNASVARFPVLPYDGQPTGGGMDPERIHMTQVYDRKYNRGGAPRSADCGPTSLAMGLEALGLSPRGSAQDKIDAARLAMFRGADASRDGFDMAGKKSQAEHGTSTNISDWRRGARAAGARSRDVRSVADVAREVSQGHPVVLAGRNAGNIYGRGHGISFNGGHAILVSGYDRASGTFILNDPLSHGGPIRVNRAQLAAFLWDGDGGGVDGIALMR
ncbi:hypothetical protein DYH09_04985 [bacterium CPR1]|nr:hypothetical protein [bacterium CPR1]